MAWRMHRSLMDGWFIPNVRIADNDPVLLALQYKDDK